MDENTKILYENQQLREWLKITLKCLEKLEQSELSSNMLKAQVFESVPSAVFKRMREAVDYD